MSSAGRGGGLGSRLRSALSGWTADRERLEAAEEQEHAKRMGGTPCAQLQDRARSTVSGVLRTVTLRPRAGVPALEAELFDGTGSLSVIWLGRREIAGVEPGRRINVYGLISRIDGRSVMYNPRYELVSGEGS